jgi:dienelactone hydrolase
MASSRIQVSVQVSSGVSDLRGSQLPYDLYVPEGTQGPLLGVVMLHGFSSNRTSLCGHARRVAASGMAAVLTPDGSSLMKGGMAVAQERNIAQAVDFAAWLAEQPSVKGGPGIVLVGHSAGGAIAFEAAMAMAAAGAAPRAVFLFDPVPWPRTLALAPKFPSAQVPLFAVRCPDSAWNAKGSMRGLVQAIPQDEPGACVAYMPRSRHGDPVDPMPAKGLCMMKMFNLLGAPGSSVFMAELLDAFLASCQSAQQQRQQRGGGGGDDDHASDAIRSAFEARLGAMTAPQEDGTLVIERRWAR